MEDQQQDQFTLDVQIASGLGAKMLSDPESIKVLSNAFTGSNPAKAIGMFLAQMVERIQERFDDSDTPLDPSIWFAPDGVLDELGDELSDIAEAVGAEFTRQTMDAIKQEVMVFGQQRSAQMEGQESEQVPPQRGGFLGGMS